MKKKKCTDIQMGKFLEDYVTKKLRGMRKLHFEAHLLNCDFCLMKVIASVEGKARERLKKALFTKLFNDSRDRVRKMEKTAWERLQMKTEDRLRPFEKEAIERLKMNAEDRMTPMEREMIERRRQSTNNKTQLRKEGL